jgi:hypothetical protein
MPLLDHFHPPLSEERHWEGFHSKWANVLVDDLNERLLPPGFFAEPHTHLGPRVEIDAATFSGNGSGRAAGAPVTLAAKPWTPPAPQLTLPAIFPDTFEVQVISTESGPTLVAAIELVSPGNKDRPESRRSFAIKCASYLVQGVSLIVVDVVTNRHANLHDELVGLLPGGDSLRFPGTPFLYATAYRPMHRDGQDHHDVWLEALALGQRLPEMPLALTADLCLPIPLETTYMESCRKLRLPV